MRVSRHLSKSYVVSNLQIKEWISSKQQCFPCHMHTEIYSNKVKWPYREPCLQINDVHVFREYSIALQKDLVYCNLKEKYLLIKMCFSCIFLSSYSYCTHIISLAGLSVHLAIFFHIFTRGCFRSKEGDFRPVKA